MGETPIGDKPRTRRADMTVAATPDDNLSEFQSPEEYDCEFGEYEPEGPFYEALAERTGGPILDLACGTGRIAIPLAKRGFAVTGVDLAAPMLAHARRKSGTAPLRWVEADCRSFALKDRFALALMSGNAFQAYLADADQQALARQVHRHLAPGGRFAFETRNPRPADLAGYEAETYWHSYTDPAGRRIDVSLIEIYDPAAAVLDCHVFRRTAGTGDPVRRTRIRIRYTDRHHVVALLRDAGFAIEAQYGDFDRSPASDDAPRIVTIARRRD